MVVFFIPFVPLNVLRLLLLLPPAVAHVLAAMSNHSPVLVAVLLLLGWS
jgi:hypothetical protein